MMTSSSTPASGNRCGHASRQEPARRTVSSGKAPWKCRGERLRKCLSRAQSPGLTGHTGFKGSWLCLWLQALGAEISGLALDPPSEPSHWGSLELPIRDHRIDIRDEAAVRGIFAAERPEIVFHLGCPAVGTSVLPGASHHAGHQCDGRRACTRGRASHTRGTRRRRCHESDKCYENREWPWAYRERDRLGGHDPLQRVEGRRRVGGRQLPKCAAGNTRPLRCRNRLRNVIGGGDWSEDRLIPDLVRSVAARDIKIRAPRATTPATRAGLPQRVLAQASGCWPATPPVPMPGTSAPKGRTLRSSRCSQTLPATHGHRFSGERHPIRAARQVLTAPDESAKAKTHLGWRPVWNSGDSNPPHRQLVSPISKPVTCRAPTNWPPTWPMQPILQAWVGRYREHSRHCPLDRRSCSPCPTTMTAEHSSGFFCACSPARAGWPTDRTGQPLQNQRRRAARPALPAATAREK